MGGLAWFAAFAAAEASWEPVAVSPRKLIINLYFTFINLFALTTSIRDLSRTLFVIFDERVATGFALLIANNSQSLYFSIGFKTFLKFRFSCVIIQPTYENGLFRISLDIFIFFGFVIFNKHFSSQNVVDHFLFLEASLYFWFRWEWNYWLILIFKSAQNLSISVNQGLVAFKSVILWYKTVSWHLVFKGCSRPKERAEIWRHLLPQLVGVESVPTSVLLPTSWWERLASVVFIEVGLALLLLKVGAATATTAAGKTVGSVVPLEVFALSSSKWHFKVYKFIIISLIN